MVGMWTVENFCRAALKAVFRHGLETLVEGKGMDLCDRAAFLKEQIMYGCVGVEQHSAFQPAKSVDSSLS